ncbi:hypothetical protein AB4Y45_41805 [Paraburkholderia sp. EG287A]|uniref:hypothetical protein n=1 Tax=unclassified Paraburkholderia TaxID=2615204 RepID=UPI0034D15557
MDRNLRDNDRNAPELFKRIVHFCEKYDAAAFDPDAQTLPLDFFESGDRAKTGAEVGSQRTWPIGSL